MSDGRWPCAPGEETLDRVLWRLGEEETRVARAARRLLEAAREREKSLQAAIRDPLVATGPQGTIRQTNEPARALLVGSGPGPDPVGRPLAEFVTEPRRSAFRFWTDQLRERRRPLVFGTLVASADGEPTPVEAVGSAVGGPEGTFAGAFWLFRDDVRWERRADRATRALTRSEAERAAAEQAERRLQLLSAARGILAEQMEGPAPLQEVAELVVPEWADRCRIWVRTDDGLREVAGGGGEASEPGFLPVGKRLRLEPDDPEGALARAVAENRAYAVATPDRSDPAVVMPVGGEGATAGPRRALVTPVQRAGRAEGAVVMEDHGMGPGLGREDLVVASQLAGLIATAREESRLFGATLNARRERDEVRMVSHDLRNALMSLSMCLDELGDSRDVTDRDAWLGQARQKARQMSRLVDTLDDVSRASTLGVDPAPHEPGKLLEGAVRMFEAVADRNGIRLRVEVDPDTPGLVEADRQRIEQVLSNLIENALRFTSSGGGVLLAASPGPEGFVEFSVEDTGPGIPDRDLPDVFDRFWTRDRHGTGEGGAGLGLAIVRHLVRAHGGEVRAESPEGTGARITFTLPVARP